MPFVSSLGQVFSLVSLGVGSFAVDPKSAVARSSNSHDDSSWCGYFLVRLSWETLRSW